MFEVKVRVTATCAAYLAAAFAIVVWGVTFASTRSLLEEFSALEILVLRFALAWVALWACELCSRIARGSRDDRPAGGGWRDEALFAGMGLTGVAAYQFLENCAIYYTNASNVAILVSFGPVVTAVLSRIFVRDKSLSPRFVAGALVATSGVALVVLEGVDGFQLRPLGDIMAFCAMAGWGFYSVLVDVCNRRGIAPIRAVRKSFGWALAMMSPLAVWGATDAGYVALDGSYSVTLDFDANLERFASARNLCNLAFLGLLASAACFWLWSFACRTLGVVRATVGLYLTPVAGIAFAVVFLGERLAAVSAAGGALIIAGVACANSRNGGKTCDGLEE